MAKPDLDDILGDKDKPSSTPMGDAERGKVGRPKTEGEKRNINLTMYFKPSEIELIEAMVGDEDSLKIAVRNFLIRQAKAHHNGK